MMNDPHVMEASRVIAEKLNGRQLIIKQTLPARLST
jgi:hypothetical protein